MGQSSGQAPLLALRTRALAMHPAGVSTSSRLTHPLHSDARSVSARSRDRVAQAAHDLRLAALLYPFDRHPVVLQVDNTKTHRLRGRKPQAFFSKRCCERERVLLISSVF